MKRILILSILILLILFGCNPSENKPSTETITYLDVYYLNDFHGAIEKSGSNLGLAYIANYIEEKRMDNPEGTILLAGGDMLQGSALSNSYHGKSTLSLMEEMGFDAMVAGNHEFDWGIETVTENFLGTNALSFPLLGANIFHKGTSNLVEGIDPYTIITRADIRVGVIGIMGDRLESSIATSRVKDYEFNRSLQMVKFYAKHLREEEKVDYVMVLMHDGGSINGQIDQLSGVENVDVIFNAHDHRREVSRLANGTLAIKSGSNGQAIGHVRINVYTNQMTGINVISDPLLNTPLSKIKTMIDQYKLETDEIFLTPIISAGEYMSTEELTVWVASLIRKRTNADIAFHNTGGTRASIIKDEVINYAKIYQVLPFDNVIKSAYIKGSDVKIMMSDASLRFSTERSSFVDDVYYLVSTNDYIFDQVNRPFVDAENQVYHGDIIRDLMRDELIIQLLFYDVFLLLNELKIPPLETQEDEIRP